VIDTKTSMEAVNLKVVNADGVVVHTELIPELFKLHTLSLQHLPAGMYYVELKSAETSSIHSIIVLD